MNSSDVRGAERRYFIGNIARLSVYEVLMRSILVSLLAPLALGALGALSAAEPAKVTLGDRETIVFFGDSITEQHLYTAYIESFLVTRYPGKELICHNFGWGGDTAWNGCMRYARDVQPVHPSLVFVNFGMNDGGYRGPDEGVRSRYLESQRKLADLIKASNAREVLLTTSCTDPNRRDDGDLYNTTLSAMAEGLIAFGASRDVPVIDVFHPMLKRQQAAKKADVNFSMIGDSVHPDSAGHLVLAWPIIQALSPMKPLARIAIAGQTATADGAMVTGVKRDALGVSFALTLNAIPMWVPMDARRALSLIPFEAECNATTLTVDGLEPEMIYQLQIDGQAIDELSAKELTDGVDLSLLERAPWAQQGKRVWEMSQARWQRHFDTWRRIGLSEDEDFLAMSETARVQEANRTLVRALAFRMKQTAKPKTHQVLVQRCTPIAITSVEVSPAYPMEGDFAQKFAPESVGAVLWKKTPLAANGMLDLNAVLGNPTNCAAYVRVVLSASEAATLHYSLGSDDGLIVLLDGKRMFSHDVWRACIAGEEQVDLPITAGRHVAMFRVNNGGGGYGLSLKISTLGAAKVTALR